jgi:S-adenosylmethionine synthetase
VGKLYNVAASRIAAAVVEEIDPVEEAQCALVSRIGSPVDEPFVVDLRVRVHQGVALKEIAPRVRECAAAQIAGIGGLWEPIARGEISLY